MQYLALIYTVEAQEAAQSPEAQQASMAEYFAYNKLLQEAGVYVSAEALHPTAAATTVKVRDGKTVTTHGPFAETKEQLGGYYLLECKDLDEALGWAAKCPGARHGQVEVRPVVDFSAMA